jgi:hypothetical protein
MLIEALERDEKKISQTGAEALAAARAAGVITPRLSVGLSVEQTDQENLRSIRIRRYGVGRANSSMSMSRGRSGIQGRILVSRFTRDQI